MDKPNDITPIIEKYISGMSPRIIGKSYGDFGVTAQCVRNWLRNAGVKLRPRGGPNNRGQCHKTMCSLTKSQIREGVTVLGYRDYANMIGVHESCLHLFWRKNMKEKK